MADAAFVSALAKALALPAPSLDSYDSCELPLASGLRATLLCQPETGLLKVVIALGHRIAARRDQLHVTLMLANRYLGEQGDPYFALLPDASQVVLCRSLQVGPHDAAAAATVLERMALAAQEFRDRLTENGLLTG